MDKVLIELIDALKSASPHIWQILMKQVYGDAVVELVFSILLVIAGCVLIKLTFYAKARYKEDRFSSWDAMAVISAIVAITGFATSNIVFLDAMQKFYNPEYYAIQLILSHLSK